MDRREEIYETAMALFISEGYEHTPLSHIAKALNLTKAGLYHYCNTKQELLYFTHMHYLKKFFIPILDEAEKVKDPQERITCFIQTFVGESLTRNAATRVLIHEVNKLTPAHQKKIKQVWQRALKLLQHAILDLQHSGECKDVNHTFAAFTALGMCSWTAYWFDFDRRETAEELSETYLKIFFKGLLNERNITESK